MLKDEVRTNVLIRNIFHEWLGLNRLLVSIQCCYLFKQFSVVTPSNCWRHHSSIIIWYSPCGKFWNNKKYPKIWNWNWRYMYRNHIKMYLNKLQMVIFVDLCHIKWSWDKVIYIAYTSAAQEPGFYPPIFYLCR